MTTTRILLVIAVCAVCTFATRLAPFVLFGRKDEIPPMVRYLGNALPPAVIALLVVYCLRNMDFAAVGHFVPSLLAVACTALLHIWKRNNLLSIGVGTALYMFLVQAVFV